MKVYDFDFNLLAETRHPISYEWDLEYNGIGSFEASFDIYSDFANVFSQNRYLLIEDDNAQAVCVGSKIKDKLYVYGRTPEWLLSKRVVLPFKTSEIFGAEYTDPETIILYLLNNAYKTPHPVGEDGTVDETAVDTGAVCENLIIPEPVGFEKLTRHFWRNNANPLSDVIADLCALAGCAYKLRFDASQKCWRFSLYSGAQRDLVVSKSLKNAYDMSLTESLTETANGGYFEIYDSEETETKKYGYVSGSSETTGMLKWDRVLGSASGLSEARNILMKYGVSQKTECEILGAAVGEDYNIGDIVRVQIEIGSFRTTLKKRVGGISIVSTSSQCSTNPVFTDV